MSPDWPFEQPPNLAVISLRQIIEGREPIQHVSHDSDDDGWQFLTLGEFGERDAVVVCLSEMLELDGSIRELADLPPGWHAQRRTSADPWIRIPPRHEEE